MSTRKHQRDDRGSAGPDTTEKVVTRDAGRLTWWLTGGSVLLVGALVAVVVTVIEGGDGTVAPDPARVAELEASAADRHVDQVAELIEHTRAAHEGLVPVLESLDEALPEEGSDSAGDLPDSDTIADWSRTTDNARAHLDHAESGETGFNVTHAGLRGSVDVLGSTLDALDVAVAADEEQSAELLELTVDLRDQAVRAWSVAATQLDVISIDAGHGHIHLYLPAAPGSGALEPDEAEDGDEAVDGAPGHQDH